jgi:hypothetical protein
MTVCRTSKTRDKTQVELNATQSINLFLLRLTKFWSEQEIQMASNALLLLYYDAHKDFFRVSLLSCLPGLQYMWWLVGWLYNLSSASGLNLFLLSISISLSLSLSLYLSFFLSLYHTLSPSISLCLLSLSVSPHLSLYLSLSHSLYLSHSLSHTLQN